MSLQFPIPQFTGQAVRYQGTSWVWDGVAWHIDREASRLDLALIPAYLAQLVHSVPAGSPTFISLSDRDIYGATYVLATQEPWEAVKVYLNGLLLVMDDGTGTLGHFQINRAANRIDFLIPLAERDIVHIGVVTPPDMLAPGRVDIWPIQDLDFDWVTTPGTPIPGQVDGVRRTFNLTILVPGGDQEFAIVGRPEELAVFIGGIRQQAGVDYTSLSSTITMTVAPQPGVSFWAMWYRPAGASSGGGGSIGAPQPPLDQQLLTYNWVPGSGAEWVDARGLARTVASAGDRTGLRNNIDTAAGLLILQADTDELWRNTAPGWRRYLDAGLMGAVAAGGRIQHLRSSVAAQRPPAGGLPGQIWVNLADGIIGWFNDAGNPVALFVPPDLAAEVNARLPLVGGTLTGFLTLHADPTAALHAATRRYVDATDTAIRAAFAAADASIRTDFTAADSGLRFEFQAADNAIGVDFRAADTAIRTDFAAADAALLTNINTRLPLAGGTMTGLIVARVAAAASASLRLPPGAAPSAPVDGDVWTTGLGVFARVNGVTFNLAGASVTVGPAAPINPMVGSLWFRNVDPVGLFVWHTSTNGFSQWVQTASGTGAAAAAALSQRIEELQTLVSTQEGEITSLQATDMVKTSRITELAAAVTDLEARDAARDAQQDVALAAVAARDTARDGRQDRRIAALAARIAALEARP